jgi:Fe(3+) dicitrate transport protein
MTVHRTWASVALAVGVATADAPVRAQPTSLPFASTSTVLTDRDLEYFDVTPSSERGRVDDGPVEGVDRLSVFGRRIDVSRIAGSAHVVDEDFLERWEPDDIHRVLRSVPGVYVRDEDGFGLRPNIGLRGAFSDRSSKVTLTEDGILLKPAPYAAPAAYYFPLMTRMTSVEVIKGPAAITAGPNTIGGALNLTTREVPIGTTARVDLSGGNTSAIKVHGYAGTGTDVWGVLFEGAHVRSAGFKELPSEAETGFDRNDLVFKARLNTPAARAWQHRLDLKLGFGTEISNETYLGLTDDDFSADSLQRYPASELDRMTWERGQVELSYSTARKPWRLRLTGYWHPFQRTWRRFDDFAQGVSTEPDNPTVRRRVGEVLRAGDPQAAELVDVLRGNLDSRDAILTPDFVPATMTSRTTTARFRARASSSTSTRR